MIRQAAGNREVASFAVLGDDNPDWRPNSFGYRRWGVEVGFRFPMVKLLDFAARRSELEESSNPFATVVLAHLDTQQTRQDQSERKERKLRLIKRLRQRGWSETQVRQLFKLIDWLMELPEPLASEFWNQLKQYNEEQHMPFITTPERYGRIEGRAKGRLEGIEAVLEVRFQDAGLQLMPEIRLISNPEKLETILQAAKTVDSPEELRKLWADGAAG